MSKEFLGTGWKFPVNADARRRIAVSQYEEDIKEAIWTILGTSKGERLMRPEFGCGIHDYVFISMNALNLRFIENTVREALTLWEPRIEVLNVSTDTRESDNGKLIVNIEYNVRATNTQFNLVYPFYLKEG